MASWSRFESDSEVTLTAKIGTQVVKEIIIEVSKYPDLTTEKIAMLVEELTTAYPCVIEFPRPDEDSKTNPSIRSPRPFDLADLAEPFDWVGPTEKQITTYRTAYGEWVERARDLMRTQPAVKQEPAFEARFELALSNEGTAPAESVWVTFEVSDGLAFKNTRRVDDSNQDHNQRGTKTTGQRPVLGVPPIAPRWKKIYRRQSSSDASPLAHPIHRSIV